MNLDSCVLHQRMLTKSISDYIHVYTCTNVYSQGPLKPIYKDQSTQNEYIHKFVKSCIYCFLTPPTSSVRCGGRRARKWLVVHGDSRHCEHSQPSHWKPLQHCPLSETAASYETPPRAAGQDSSHWGHWEELHRRHFHKVNSYLHFFFSVFTIGRG